MSLQPLVNINERTGTVLVEDISDEVRGFPQMMLVVLDGYVQRLVVVKRAVLVEDEAAAQVGGVSSSTDPVVGTNGHFKRVIVYVRETV